MELSVLCKVVDNFGDIGVAWRMARRFTELDSRLKVNLIIDGLSAFSKIENSVNLNKNFQIIKTVCVCDWNDYDFCYNYFSENGGQKILFIIECFQCGRPQWLEKILFEDKLKKTVHILMIDYLTAEKYAEDFHKLQSLTRSANVQKINFMPGFTNKTGGLIIENDWKKLPKRNKNGNVLFFVYEKNWDGIAKSIIENLSCKVTAAGGAGFDSVKKSFKKLLGNDDFNLRFKELPFCNQQEWDFLLKSCSFLFIRGEESLSRACLSGIPFVWHAYVQSEEYQIVKVNALLKIMQRYFLPENFEIVKRLWLLVNTTNQCDITAIKVACDDFFKKGDELSESFGKFAQDLRKNGDLCFNVMTFIKKNYII